MGTIIIALIHWAIVSATILVVLGIVVLWHERDGRRFSAANPAERPALDWPEEYRQNFRRHLTIAQEAQVELEAELAVFAAKVYDDNIVGREQANHDAQQVRELIKRREGVAREVEGYTAKLANIAGPVPNEMDLCNPQPEVAHLYRKPVTVTVDGAELEQPVIAYNISEGWVRVYADVPQKFGVAKTVTLHGEVAVTFGA